MISILSIYRGVLTSDRGTTIRVRSIIKELFRHDNIVLFTANWGENFFGNDNHIILSNKHFSELRDLIFEINSKKIDVVLGHTISSVYYLLPIKIFTKAKVVLEMHGFLEEEEYLYGGINIFSYYIKKIFFHATYFFMDLIITCSDTAANYIKKYNHNTVTVYGGVDIEIFHPLNNVEINMNSNIIVGYAGNTRIWQGLDFLLESMYFLNQTHNNFKLKLLCSESGWKLPERYHYFTEVVSFLPYNDVPKFLNTCDILVIPRMNNKVNHLSFPSKIIEYMAMGKPVLASATSDCQNIIKSGVDGLIFEPGNRADFIDKLLLLEDGVYRLELGGNALKKMSNFTWGKQTDIIIKNINILCQKRTGKKIN